MNDKVRINPEIAKDFKPGRYPFRKTFAKMWAKYHLKFICPKCPEEKRSIRDIEDKDECYWNSNWEKGNYDIPLWMGFKESQRIKKELKK